MQASAPIMMTHDDSSSSSDEDDNNNVPKIVVENAVDEDREPDVRTESLLKVYLQYAKPGKETRSEIWNLLQDLRSDLTDTMHEDAETEEDRQYRLNLSQGRDKFKTLREVRRGNTKRRIDTFENM